MSRFDKWYFTGEKCDIREFKDKGTNQYYKIKEAWDHQQEEIDRLSDFCKEFVYYEENPNEYKTMQEKLDEAYDLIREGFAVHEESNSTGNFINKLDCFHRKCCEYFKKERK